MGRGTRKLHPWVTESSSRRRPSERVRAAAKRMDEVVKSSISPEPGRKKYTGRLPGKCANPRVRRCFLIDWIQKIVPVDLIDFAGKLRKRSNPAPFPRRPSPMAKVKFEQRRTIVRRIMCVTWMSCFFAVSVMADQVTLKNGDRLTGSIVKSDAKTLLIKTEFAGEVNVQWDAVSGMVSSQPLHLALKDGQTIVGTVTAADNRLDVATKATGSVTGFS